MSEKMPYYLAYPVPFSYDDERTERMDFEYLKSMYPDLPKRILPYVEEECDRMEYAGSMVYDQYPDKLQLKLMCRRIYDHVRAQERLDCVYEDTGCDAQKERGKGAQEHSVRDLIEVMLFQELYRRRCDHRRRCRRLF